MSNITQVDGVQSEEKFSPILGSTAGAYLNSQWTQTALKICNHS